MTVLSAAQSLLQALLAALGPGQHQRLLRLHTPLGPNVLLAERMLGVETIGPRAPGASPAAGFRFEVLALSTNAHLRLKDLMGQPVRLDLLTQHSLTALRPFHGHVTAFALLGSDGGLARYKLTIEPWLSFLGHRQDAWVFQDKTVVQIIDEVFADYQAQGKLAPAWRWELADPEVYPRRSLCIQYHESDLAFVQRLMAEEGLFCWFEHQAAEGDTLGQHTLVIADHNGCFQPNVQPQVRYTQSASASFREDSLTGFNEVRRLVPASLAASSWDHRAVQQTNSEAPGDGRLVADGLALALRDQPGAYAYEDSAQAQRVVQRQIEAVQAPAFGREAEGAFRQAACGTVFQLSGHPSAPAGARWVTLSVQHRGRNNITADLSTSLKGLLGSLPAAFGTGDDEQASARSPRPSLFKGMANATHEPLYVSRLLVQDAEIPVRAAPSMNERGDIVFQRPQVSGTQTAIVVGLGEPVHTDRDGRIKVQLHWQRGASSALRLDHAAGSNAPGDDSTGTWVRVMQPWAGANWGAHFTPRLGQEVLVSFVEGDIDRPVVIGSAYNGQGSTDAQGNQVSTGAGGATGNAGAWFPGGARSGNWQGHQHPQVLAGFKSQSLDASQSGGGGYNQLALDDSLGESRTVLGSTTAATWLQLGHLLQQDDNQRLAARGHGLDLATTAHGAVRGGSGLLLSTFTRPQGTQSAAQSIETRATLNQLEESRELARTLADTAQKQQAKLEGEPSPEELPGLASFVNSADSVNATLALQAAAMEAADGIAEAESEPRPVESVFDEQIRFVSTDGQALARVNYILHLDDGQQVTGVTDDDGRTQRVTTASAKAFRKAELSAVDNPTAPACCAKHRDQSTPSESVEVPLQEVRTNPEQVGSSVKEVKAKNGGSRPLTSGETAMARELFGDAVDYSRVKVHNKSYFWFNLQSRRTAVTPNGEIYFRREDFKADFAEAKFSDRLWFIHEMVHVWQYQLGYPVKAVGLFSWAASYEYTLSPERSLSDYNMEQQGDLLADYWALKSYGRPAMLNAPQYIDDKALYEIVLQGFLVNPSDRRWLPKSSSGSTTADAS
jgi:type VI secretion system secreted protein VgrG